jgi:hypothetical protein
MENADNDRTLPSPRRASGASMRAICHGLVSVFHAPRRRILPAIVLGLLTIPLAVAAFARDKSDRETRRSLRGKNKGGDTTAVARQGNDATTLAGSPPATPKVVEKALEAARSSRDSLQKLPGYTCTFTKQEQVNKKGPLLRQVMTLKFRREPFSVYLKFVEPHPGREVLYVDGKNKGKLLVHEPSGLVAMVGTIALAPTSSDVMKENRYPVTMIGMEKMIDTAIGDWEDAGKDADIQVDMYPQAKVGDAECTMFETMHPASGPGLKYHKSRLYIDKKTNLPIRSEQYAFPAKAGDEPPLFEEYTYSNLQLDTPPGDADFDANNKSYSFK